MLNRLDPGGTSRNGIPGWGGLGGLLPASRHGVLMRAGHPRRQDSLATLALLASLVLAPLPFGSVDKIAVSFWCLLLGIGLASASPVRLGVKRILVLLAVSGLAAAIVGVAVLQGIGPSGLVKPDPIWIKAGELLGPLPKVPGVARWEPIFALGNPLACLAALSLGLIVGARRRNTRYVLGAVAVSGLCYAIYGIVAALFTPDMVLWHHRQGYFGNALGPFLNRNTAAVYFGCCACLWLTMTGKSLIDADPRLLVGLSGRSIVLSHRFGHLTRLACTLICTAALLMTSSRAATLLSLLALCALAATTLWQWTPRRRQRGALRTRLLVAALFVVPLLSGTSASRFAQVGFSDENRLDVYRSTWHIIRDHPWLGSGLGTFPLIFPSYRDIPPEIWGVWLRAHSTPLELAAELGVPLALAIMIASLVAFVILLLGIRATRGREVAPLAAAAAMAIAALHSCVDFSLQIPGCAMVVMAMVGLGLSQVLHEAQPNRAMREGLHIYNHDDRELAPGKNAGRMSSLPQWTRFGTAMPIDRRRISEMLSLLKRTTVITSPTQQDEVFRCLLSSDRAQILSFMNQYAFNLAYEDVLFRRTLDEADHLLRDGVGIEIVLKLLGLPTGLNANGTDIIPVLLAGAGTRKVAVFGTREPWLSAALSHLDAIGILVVTSLDGFRPRSDYVEAVRRTDPDIVVLAMGMPRQEVVASELRATAERPRLIVNGGAIVDFYAGRFKRAPLFMRRLRLEWLFRLCQEPRRLAPRYLLGGAKFFWRIALVTTFARLGS